MILSLTTLSLHHSELTVSVLGRNSTQAQKRIYQNSNCTKQK